MPESSPNSQKFIREIQIARPPHVVFAFHERPGALLDITPPWEHVSIDGPIPPLKPGQRVTLRTKIGMISVTWVAEYTDDYERGRLFTDRQVSGPFAYWLHHHRFLDDGSGGTILRDEVDYVAPFGLLGRWMAPLAIEPRLNRMFDYRHEATKRLVESE